LLNLKSAVPAASFRSAYQRGEESPRQFAIEEHDRMRSEMEEELRENELSQGGSEPELPLKAQPDGNLLNDGTSVGIAMAIAPALRTLLEDRT
jgi:hypothetical protein